MTHHLSVFDDLTGLFDYVEQPHPNVAIAESRRSGDDRVGFTGTVDFPEAVALARRGWSECRSSVDRQLHDIDSKVRSIVIERPVTFHDVAGAYVDVAAYLSGEPECMIEVAPRILPATGRIVRLLVNGGASWSVDKELIQARGAAVCALVDALSREQLYVEVYSECSIKPKHTGRNTRTIGDRLSTVVKVKAADDPLDIDLLMFALGHSAFLRRIMFDVWERQPAKIRRVFGIGNDIKNSYYGVPVGCLMGDMLNADIVLAEQPSRLGVESKNPAAWIAHWLEKLAS